MRKKTSNNNKNPYNICTWQDITKCEKCSLKSKLKCRFEESLKDTLIFISGFLAFIIPAIVGMIISGIGIFIIGWILYAIIFFQFWEIRILCRHCPFWAEEGKTLHCYANYGLYKLWKYEPGPMSLLEKIQFIFALLIFTSYYVIFFIIFQNYLFLILNIVGIIIFFLIIQIRNCPYCVNFSCPLNRVSKENIDEYLKRNPIMKDAWEKNGYKVD